ncbi:hypothetical protein V2J09_022325 [Rumex salicifolius]
MKPSRERFHTVTDHIVQRATAPTWFAPPDSQQSRPKPLNLSYEQICTLTHSIVQRASTLIAKGFSQRGYYFAYMSEVYGIKPRTEYFGCMVTLLGKRGFLEEARKLIEEVYAPAMQLFLVHFLELVKSIEKMPFEK